MTAFWAARGCLWETGGRQEEKKAVHDYLRGKKKEETSRALREKRAGRERSNNRKKKSDLETSPLEEKKKGEKQFLAVSLGKQKPFAQAWKRKGGKKIGASRRRGKEKKKDKEKSFCLEEGETTLKLTKKGMKKGKPTVDQGKEKGEKKELFRWKMVRREKKELSSRFGGEGKEKEFHLIRRGKCRKALR